MKIATVEYTGNVRNATRRGPSGRSYSFNPAVEVEDREDAAYFERRSAFDVNYTARGRLLGLIQDDVDDVRSVIEGWDYQVKRSLASSLDLETESNEQAVLEEAIVAEVENLRRQMENQP